MIFSIEAADEDKYTCAVSTINKEEISHIPRVRSKFHQTHFLIIFFLRFSPNLVIGNTALNVTAIL